MKPIERIANFIDLKGLNVSKFEKSVGLSNGSIQTAIKRNSNLKDETLNSILNHYPEIDPVWLLTGKGEMKKNLELEKNILHDTKINEPIIDNQSIPFYSEIATASIATLLKSTSSFTPADLIRIPNMPKCDGAITVTGDSMYPIIKSGDIVIFKNIHDFPENIFFGNMYIISIDIEGDEMIMVKYIKKGSSEETILLVSENKHHADKEVHIKNITSMALVKANIRFNSLT